MNPHIATGIEALRSGDSLAAAAAFTHAMDDPDPLVRRIARHRLYDIHGEAVYGSTHSYQQLYHRPNCPAKNVIWRRHIVWFRDWEDAEKKGYQPCANCRPVHGRHRASDARRAS